MRVTVWLLTALLDRAMDRSPDCAAQLSPFDYSERYGSPLLTIARPRNRSRARSARSLSFWSNP